MKQGVCQKCGRVFDIWPGVVNKSTKKYCDRCGRKMAPPTQAELARRAGRTINDTVQRETDKADLEGVSYGVHMARKKRKE